MTPCQISGCRRLETKCADCGRIACTATIVSSHALGEWIKCSDLMPEEQVPVLTLDYLGNMDVCDLCYIEGKPFKWCRCGPGVTFESILCWMSLPLPPEEK